MRFSIIIPAYNVEDYLLDCVDSVIKQSFRDYEIILVNDGSTDSTLEICQELSKKNKSINLITKKNGGLSSARNAGIEIAKGDYLLFLDGDDFWGNYQFLNDLNRIIENQKDIDLIIFPWSYYFSTNNFTKYPFKLDKINFSGSFKSDYMELINQGIWYPSACNKCIRNQNINDNLLFPLNITGEDVIWCFNLSKYVKSYTIYNNPIYMYRQNRIGSISYKVTRKNIQDLFFSIEKIINDVNFDNKVETYTYLSYSYLEFIPYIKDFVDETDIMKLFKKYKWLIKYAKNTKNNKKKIVYFILKYTGLRNAVFILNVLVKLYKSRK